MKRIEEDMGFSRSGHFGELSGNGNWTDKQARMIREYRAGHFTYHDLAKLFGGSEESVADVCNGRTYPTAGGPIAGKDYQKIYGKSIL